jgi:excisionase family DNA binding protein
VNGEHVQERCLTVDEVAKLLRCSALTIRRRIRDQHIRAIKFGRQWRITMPEFRRFIGCGSSEAKA